MNPIGRFLLNAATALLAVLACAHSAEAEAIYHYEGQPFRLFSCGPAPDQPATLFCPDAPAPGNPWTSYIASDAVSATLTLAAPLPPNLPYQSVINRAGFLLIMKDGHQSLSSSGVPILDIDAHVATNQRGEIVAWSLHLPNTLHGGITSVLTPENSVQDNGMEVCCDPFVHADIALNQNAPGTWSSSATSCTIRLNGSTFADGNPVVVTVFKPANAGATPAAVELKLWVELPGFAPIPLLNVGADGSVRLPAGADANLGPFTLFTVTAQTMRGTYAFSCRLLDPVTGRLQGESLQTFVVQ